MTLMNLSQGTVEGQTVGSKSKDLATANQLLGELLVENIGERLRISSQHGRQPATTEETQHSLTPLVVD